jgi:tripartite-type tricarboxylate transporter receptor subunit TctC
VLIENRAGGGGTIGAAAAAKAAPDGYTFFVGAAHHAIAPAVYPKLSYSIEKDFVPIGMIARPPHVVVVHPGKVAAATLAELLAHVRANPDKMNYGSAGSGTTHHLAGELFKLLTKTRIHHIPYRGAGPMMQDLLAGHVDMCATVLVARRFLGIPISQSRLVTLAAIAGVVRSVLWMRTKL